jgi:hypothetical protein
MASKKWFEGKEGPHPHPLHNAFFSVLLKRKPAKKKKSKKKKPKKK